MYSQEDTTSSVGVQQEDEKTINTIEESVKLHTLRKEFGDTVAVDNIDLEVNPGELAVLLGPSGCGKTTTLRMIAGLEMPTSGTISIGNENITTLPPQERNLSMVFQSYALYPHLTVRENLEYPLQKMDLNKEDRMEKVDSVASTLGITEHLDKEPDQLSGGQQQRVAVGRTIVREPRVFLMDEPLSNLDAKLRVKTRAELRELQQQLGVTTVYVTHDQEEAMSIGDRLVIMNNGTIEQVGTPKEVYEAPTNQFVASFIGEPAINFVDLDRDWEHQFIKDVPAGAETVGVRPENIHVMNSTNDADVDPEKLSDPVSLTVDIIEPLGDTYELTLTDNAGTFITVLSRAGRKLEEGASVDIATDMSGVHLFDANGETIQ